MSLWMLVPMCERQRRDIDPADLLKNNLYRRCRTYKSGGGYDQFPAIYAKRKGISAEGLDNQFVAQVYGCSMRCPYCYVTPQGVFGNVICVSTETMVQDFRDSGCSVFHLMGGAPALYLHMWPELLSVLDGAPFHSDFILNERLYDTAVLKKISQYKNALYAVSIKGCSEAQYRERTGVVVDMQKLFTNLSKLIDNDIDFYLTFTGMTDEEVTKWTILAQESIGAGSYLQDAFSIAIRDYKALEG